MGVREDLLCLAASTLWSVEELQPFMVEMLVVVVMESVLGG